MNSLLKKALFGLAALVLFTGTYVTIAVISGAPLHEVAGISMFVDAPESTPGEPDPKLAEVATGIPPKTGTELLEANAGLLGAFTMAAPFTPSELRALENELKSKLMAQTIEREYQRVRSLELDEWERSLRERQAQLGIQRTRLEDMESNIEYRLGELLRDESIAKEREDQGWRDLAGIFKEGDAAANAKMIQEEEPANAALILRELDDAAAGEILMLITPLSTRRKFMDAYRLAVSSTPGN